MQSKNQDELPVGNAIPNWKACGRPSATDMLGDWCRVRRLSPELDAVSLWEALGSSEHVDGWTYLGYGPFGEFSEFDKWLCSAAGTDDPFFYVIEDSRRGLPLGLASYLRIQPTVGVIEVGHLHFAPALQRTPAATEAMYLMMKRAFDEFGYRRYEWKCDALNARSRAAALRLGFQYEGTFRQATIYKGRNRDTAWFSIIDVDWPSVRDAICTWLAGENFDEHGRQIKRLAEFMSGH